MSDKPLDERMLERSIAYWGEHGVIEVPATAKQINALAALLTKEVKAATLSEAKCCFTNWNVADGDFDKWLLAHIRDLEAEK